MLPFFGSVGSQSLGKPEATQKRSFPSLRYNYGHSFLWLLFLDFSQENFQLFLIFFCFIPVELQVASHEAHAIDFQMLLLGFLDVAAS